MCVIVFVMGGLSFFVVGMDGIGYVIARRDLGYALYESYFVLVLLMGLYLGGEFLLGVFVEVELKVVVVNVDGGGGKKKV